MCHQFGPLPSGRCHRERGVGVLARRNPSGRQDTSIDPAESHQLLEHVDRAVDELLSVSTLFLPLDHIERPYGIGLPGVASGTVDDGHTDLLERFPSATACAAVST